MERMSGIFVLGKHFVDHLDKLTRVLDRFKKYNLRLKPKRCNLLQSEIKFLGKVISAEGIEINS